MALDPLELIIIGVIVLVVFLWGPKKIPELARSIGLARKEFSQAKKEIENPSAVVFSQEQTGDELTEVAHRLGIATEGKTREQISDEIVLMTTNKRSR